MDRSNDLWIDGLMDRWIDWWIDRCIDRWINWLIYRLIDRWIDGWFDRCIDGSMDVLIDGWFNGLMDWWIDRSMHWSMDRWNYRSMGRSIELLMYGWINRSIDGSIKWSMNRWIDQSMDWPMDWLIDRCFDRWIDWLIDVLINGSVDPWFNGSIDWRPCRRQRQLERVFVWDIEWGFLHYWWQVNTFRDIVDGSQCKCKRKSWFLFYSFLWTCRETAKSKALEIVNCAYAGCWRSVSWSEKCQLGRCTNQRWGAQAQTHVIAHWFVDITEFFPDTTVFTIKKLAMRTDGIKI